jgi:hypothetical protein
MAAVKAKKGRHSTEASPFLGTSESRSKAKDVRRKMTPAEVQAWTIECVSNCRERKRVSKRSGGVQILHKM